MDTFCTIQYKLRMMGITISGPKYINEDNLSAINNALKLESTLMKKFDPIVYHAIHKSVAMRESLTGHIRSEDNPILQLTC